MNMSEANSNMQNQYYEQELAEEDVKHTKTLKTRLKTLWKIIKSYQIRMEIVILAISICDTARIVITPTLMDEKVRRVYEVPDVVDNSTDSINKFFNQKIVLWDQNYNYVNLPLTIAATIFFGSFSDQNGRKIPMIFGLIGMLMGNMVYISVWWYKTDFALQWLFLAAVLNGITGGFRMVTSSVNAYLSDQFEIKTVLSIRMLITYTILNVGDLIGSQLTKLITHHFDELWAAFFMQIVNILILVYVIFVVKDINRPYHEYDLVKIAKDGVYSLWSSIKLVLRKRKGNFRLLLWLTFVCVLINRSAFNEEKDLIGVYTKLGPFHWTTEDFAVYKSYRPFVQILGLLIGLFVFKNWLKLKDTTVIILATLSMGLDSLLIGLAQSSTLIYISLVAGILHALTNPLIFTLYSCLVSPSETGRVFAVDSVIQNVSTLIKVVVLQNLYVATINWYQGFIWLLLSSMALISMSIMTVIHVLYNRDVDGR
ncbi:unnamed protein product [Bursaphelenchus okinawaensis]|uniref:MFS domain-containing protein n=1 Tax=Bursaphelenchus okinawaensis TaxID=465554 RepID=A0A811LEP8_9BILA|nr:unnamed protein product [Bursaphelenchus okinawaensis]CAG9121663.1 unnamed protein product [Bursaphelenchus okinawaensis]